MAVPPANMNEVCRLCSTSEGKKVPIFGEVDDHDPLSYRILVCVSVEVASDDVLSTLICESCLNHVNNWFQFKQLCDSAQEKQNKWLGQLSPEANALEGEVYVKSEPIDEVIQEEEEEPCDLEIKQEALEFSDEESQQELTSVQVGTDDPLCLSSLVQHMSVQPRVVKRERVNRANVENIDPEVDTGISDSMSIIPIVSAVPAATDVKPPIKRRRKREIGVLMPANLCCPTCNKQLTSRNGFRRHLLTHTGHKYVCKLCQQAYLSSSSLWRHMQAHKGKMPFKCSPCRVEFSGQAEFDQHRLTCSLVSPVKLKVGPVKCHPKLIPMKVPVKSVKPVLLKNPRKTYDCSVCSKSFSNRIKLKSHTKIHQTWCRFCKRDFKSRAGFQNHMKTHATKLKDGKKVKRYLCKFCPKVLSHWNLAVKHKQAHLEKKQALNGMPTLKPKPEMPVKKKNVVPYKCQECSETFTYWKQYIKHNEMHVVNTIGSPRRYSCKTCNEEFKGWYSLVRHRELHASNAIPSTSAASVSRRRNSTLSIKTEAPRLLVKKKTIINPVALLVKTKFTCHICDREFKNSGSLERHKTTHTKVKNFSCHLCGARMKYATSVQQHLKSVHNVVYQYGLIKPDVSTVARKTEDETMPTLKKENNDVARRGPSSVTSARTYSCPLCSKGFVSKALMMTHYKIIHKRCSQMDPQQSTAVSRELPSLKSEAGRSESQPPLMLLTCAACPLTFDSAEARELHQRKENHNQMDIKIKIYSCTLCQNSYITEIALHLHRFKKHGVNTPLRSTDVAHTCYVCHKSFKNHVAMRRHLRNVHLKVESGTVVDSSRPGTSETSNVCDICKKSFADSSSMKSHRGWHFRTNYTSPSVLPPTKKAHDINVKTKPEAVTEVNGNTCNICNKSFDSVKAFKIHSTWHIKRQEYKTPDSNVCNICQKSFINARACNTHAAWHVRVEKAQTELLKNTCTVCQKQFLSIKARKIHEAWHTRNPSSDHNATTNVKNEFLKTNSNLTATLLKAKLPNHGPRKKTEKPVTNNVNSEVKSKIQNSKKSECTCPICSLSFPTTKALDSHMGWHNRNSEGFEQQMRECTYCHKKFGSASNFHRHLKICPRGANVDVLPVQTSNKMIKEKTKQSSQFSSNSVTSNVTKKTFLCASCPRQFSVERGLLTHQLWHTKNPIIHLKTEQVAIVKKKDTVVVPKSKSFHCEWCPQTFLGQKALAIHRNMHVRKLAIASGKKVAVKAPQVRPTTSFVCNFCNKIFSGPSGLSRHRQVHIRELFSNGKVVKPKRKYKKKQDKGKSGVNDH